MRVLLTLLALFLAAPVAHARTVDGGFGADRLTGTAGPDVLHGSEGPDVVRGRGGDDLLTGDSGPDTVDGGAGDDVLTGSAGRDLLRGGTGDDVASRGYGADVVFAGSGNDAIDGGADHDAIDGGPGDDLIHGGSGIDHLVGGPGDDRIWADGGDDHLRGGDGDDTIYVEGISGLRVRCGAGNDTVVLLARPKVYEAGGAKPYVEDPDCERAELSTAFDDQSRGRTYLAPAGGGRHLGTGADDKLLGGLGADHLIGGRGDDVLWGMHIENGRSTRPDRLVGGPDDDLIYGGSGRQRIDAGPGDDTVMSGVGHGDIRGGDGADTIRLRGTGRVRVRAGAGDDAIHARGPSRGRISCGSGRDVAHVDRGDRVARDCERVIGRARAASADTTPPDTFAATKVAFAADTLLAFTADEPATFGCQQGGPYPHPARFEPCSSPIPRRRRLERMRLDDRTAAASGGAVGPAAAPLEFHWTIAGGDPLTAADFPTVLESSRDLRADPPKLRIAAATATSAQVALLDARGAVRWSHPLAAAPGANVVRVPGRVLAALPTGRHELVVAAGTAVQRLPFAVVPRRR